MKTIFSIEILPLWTAFLLMSINGYAQVGIGTTQLEDGAILQIENEHKGLMIPRIALTSSIDTSTITTLTEGLWVYNTENIDAGTNSVTPGFYFWEGSKWTKMFEDGYTEQFLQTAPVRANDQSTYYTLTGLNQTIVAPFSGLYQIIVIAHYACLPQLNSSEEAVGYSSIALELDNVKVAESFVTSTSKVTGTGNFMGLAQQTSFVYNVDLMKGQSYNLNVLGKEWASYNMNTSAWQSIVSGQYGIWGMPTQDYDGNTLSSENGQQGSMTITLQRQY